MQIARVHGLCGLSYLSRFWILLASQLALSNANPTPPIARQARQHGRPYVADMELDLPRKP